MQVDMWDTDANRVTLPMKFCGRIASLSIEPEEISIRFCFIHFPYSRTITIKNNSDLDGYFYILPQQVMMQMYIRIQKIKKLSNYFFISVGYGGFGGDLFTFHKSGPRQSSSVEDYRCQYHYESYRQTKDYSKVRKAINYWFKCRIDWILRQYVNNGRTIPYVILLYHMHRTGGSDFYGAKFLKLWRS